MNGHDSNLSFVKRRLKIPTRLQYVKVNQSLAEREREREERERVKKRQTERESERQTNK